jgi:hypothetical protein
MESEQLRPTINMEHDGERVSPPLPPLLLAVYDELAREASDHGPLIQRLHALLTYLASPEGRTNANCWTADLFFCLGDDWGEVSWDHVPDELGDILADLGGALHDTVQAPDVAENFDSTPELLLQRLGRIAGSGGAT